MATFTDLIADVKVLCRETTTEKDAFLLAAAIRIYRELLRRDDWPQTRTTGAVITLVSGTQTYALPTDFDRFASDRVNYAYAGNSTYPLVPLTVLGRGTEALDRLASSWEGVSAYAGAPYFTPRAIGFTTVGGLPRLTIYPLAGATGDTIVYDYYAVPARTTINTSTTIAVDQLYEAMVAALAAEFQKYEGDLNQMGVQVQQARASLRVARQTLYTL